VWVCVCVFPKCLSFNGKVVLILRLMFVFWDVTLRRDNLIKILSETQTPKN
jgi:hypothetical protein